MDIDKPNEEGSDEIDALDAFMKNVHKEVEEIKKQDELSLKNTESGSTEFPIDQDDNDYTTEEEDEEDILALAAKKLAKRKDLIAVDHSTIQYEPFRKNFYIEPPELANMKQVEVEQVRKELDNIKVQGRNCPKPVRKWTQFGLPTGCLEVIKRVLKYQQPSPIQCQAIPAVMSGRDVISVAKTGSGKTIAFLLPMFRAIKDQRPLEPQEGPIALIMTPTRELAVQIYKECRHFTRILGLNVTCAYGGSPIKDQIAELKKGAEIIVCTPGRMIDLLCANSGRVTNLRRVTYLVLDEADRMFDMGFEPQVMKIVNNIRPDRQTLLFSATFPRQIDALARKILTKPLEITVGGKSVVCEDVEQHVEVREEETKFRRLLEILGLYYKQDLNPRTLVFVDRQEAADNLLRELIRFGYPCQSLHGGKDQADRDSTISDFKSGVTNILIATSVAARGLDVKDLNLVINYECPNHLEDYVHRVGRTGRAGNKGTAYTFVTPQQDKYANDIVSALKMSHTDIPPELQKLADEFINKVKAGDAQYSSSGFGGKGLERLDKERENSKKLQRKIHGAELDEEDEDNTDEEEEKLKESIDSKITDISSTTKTQTSTTTTSTTNPASTENKIPGKGIEADKIKAVQEIAALVNAKIGASVKAKKSMEGATPEIKIESTAVKPTTDPNASENSSLYAFEIEINDYPQKARWRVTNKEQITMITELTGAAITTRGTFFPSGKTPGPNERKLYLFIEGETQLIVDKAKTEIKRILTEATLSCIEAESRGTSSEATGRYTVI
ncbi:P-loop containing nucleoside triphosphate hydrolase protein [Piromyces finnis]|uniref:RNA helicase n=1 Tax=Piromyces finnis TaxID=1754191 RepID=A0A1Y1V0L0_9FUNG|nr:P-loop containing nucleoside triphosphate hydrolase protein [Piromyces finnis]|eukprot:ORX44050.1 P-loop containing nucleoside triphosphate hydrolase protein [Piromyces finnis]